MKMILKWIFLKIANNYQGSMKVLRDKQRTVELIINFNCHQHCQKDHPNAIRRVATSLIIGDLIKLIIVQMDTMFMLKAIH